MTSSKPPLAAVWFVELFAPIESAEGVLGDLEEEFVTRLVRSGHRAARRWYWHQALRTGVHLAWETVRAEPLSTAAQVVASFILGWLLFREMNHWVVRFVSDLSIYDYEASLWSWRAANLVRMVAIPLVLGWLIAVLARGREMTVTALVVGILIGMLLMPTAYNVRQIVFLGGWRMGVYLAFMHVLEVFLPVMVFSLSVLVGGMMRRLQVMRGPARIAG